MKIVTAGALKPLCDLLVVKETEIVTMAEDILINIHNVSRAAQTQKLKFSDLSACILRDVGC